MHKRRRFLKLSGIAGATALLPRVSYSKPTLPKSSPFIYCLNTATIRGHKLGFFKELELAAAGGFTGVEIWLESYQQYLSSGGTVADAAKKIKDLGLTIEDAIGFAPWIVDDNKKREEALEQLKKEMEILAGIGCKRIAAPPAGATALPLLDLNAVAERFRSILEIGDKTGVVPHLELWGFSKNLGKLSDVMFVAIQSDHPSAKVLLDSYHIYKGGTDPATLKLINPTAVEIFHINDYPAGKPTDTITDADRIYPGDGIAPLAQELGILKDPRRPLVLSVEVFNAEYYKDDPLNVVKTAFQKTKAVINKAGLSKN